jgi:lathosterol oxidase
MDIVLELFDTYLFDPIYATALPNKTPGFPANATYPGVSEFGPPPTWTYEPASDYLSFKPGQYAYMSQWNRDDWRRQLLTLYLITWYVPDRLKPTAHRR